MFEHSGNGNQTLLYAGGASALPRMAFAGPTTLRFHDRAGMVKQVEDMILAPVLLVLPAVPLVLFALLIRLEGPGPALFRQRRVGLDGTSFAMWKFRTMRYDREPNGTLRQARRDDPRVTRVGCR